MKTTLRKRWESRKWGLGNIGIYMSAKRKTDIYKKEAKEYCSKIDEECNTCSLVNYGRDCHNNTV